MSKRYKNKYYKHRTCMGRLHVVTMLSQIFIFLLIVDSAHTRIKLDNACKTKELGVNELTGP